MRVGIMQPYFVPYIGYFSLIKHSDLFILFDPVQFIRHGWIERNRILKQNEGWLYIQVPLIKNDSRNTLIKNCFIDNTKDWKSKIKAQLQPYKKFAPYYFKVLNIVNIVFDNDYKDIVSLNKAFLEEICSYLGIERRIFIFSEMNLDIEEAKEADEWALNICKKIESKERIHYINPIGGMEFFNVEKYHQNNIDISFQKMNLLEYDQSREHFEVGLSILDVLMFNSPKDVNIMLDQFELL